MGTTQSPLFSLLTQGAVPGLPFHTASAGHRMIGKAALFKIDLFYCNMWLLYNIM